MTKDGRPSRISDIRYFFGSIHIYLDGHEDAVAYGRRVAWYLNGEKFSLGAYPALYIYLTPDLAPDETRVTDYGGDWWQRYTWVGVPKGFPEIEGATNVVRKATIAALSAIRPDSVDIIMAADEVVRREAENLRFLIKSHESKTHLVEVSATIGVGRQVPSRLHISLTDKASGQFSDAEPLQLMFYAQAFDLAGQIKIDVRSVSVEPNTSVAASVASAAHGGAPEWRLTDFSARGRPVFSKRVFRR